MEDTADSPAVELHLTDGVEQEAALREQAAQMEHLLPRLMNRMFTLERDRPAAELPLAQLRVCIILQAGPRTLSAISEELNISVSATTQIADRLEKSGMVERISGQDDRRTKKLQLSPYGSVMMQSRREQRIQRAAHALSQLPPDLRASAVQTLNALMEAVDASLTEMRPDAPSGKIKK
jgi:DNA-binding MarR family transcriptional regulator